MKVKIFRIFLLSLATSPKSVTEVDQQYALFLNNNFKIDLFNIYFNNRNMISLYC